jgi:hypothetical protein
MRIVLCTTIGLAAVVALGASAQLIQAATVPGRAQGPATLAARLAGTWTGQATNARSTKAERLTMIWQPASDGHMTGTVVFANGLKYRANVVWSSDTAFIYESAPHQSPTLHETVVARSLVHLKAHALEGTFEARPTTYGGKTLTGSFNATRTS